MATYVGTNGDDLFNGPDAEVNFITGKAGNDRLEGGYLPDDIDGGDGDDTLIGLQGSDFISGGSGDDLILSGSDDDTVLAGLGDDTIDAGRGDDLIDLAGRTSDVRTVLAGYGDDEVLAGKGADAINGGAGQDLVSYAGSNAGVFVDLTLRTAFGGDANGDVLRSIEDLIGSRFEDQLIGNSLANVLEGGIGADNLLGKGGADLLIGGAGDDQLRGGEGPDELDGGSGFDTINYDAPAGDMTISLLDGTGQGDAAQDDVLVGIEAVVVAPGAGVSEVFGDGGANYLLADLVSGLGGADYLDGSIMSGGPGADVYNANFLIFDDTHQVIDFHNGVDRIDLPVGSGMDDLEHLMADGDDDGFSDDLHLTLIGDGGYLVLLNRDWSIIDASDFI